MYKLKKHAARRRVGFTLIEIMVVVIVIAILAAVIIPNFASKPDEARVSKAKSDIGSLETLVENFRLDMGRVPTQDEGLDILRNAPQSSDSSRWKGPYSTKDIPNDPWGNPYHYYAPSPNGVDPYGIESYGSDNQPGGEGFSADINSWTQTDTKK